MSRNKKAINITQPRVSFLVDGKTETWYFQMLRRNEKNLQVSVHPSLPQKKTLQKLFEEAKEKSENFDFVFIIVDLDIILKETRDSKKKPSPLDNFLQKKEEIETNYPNTKIIINHPCLEFWFLLHFEKSQKVFRKCEETIKILKSHLTDYKKEEKYFVKNNQDIYSRLKGKLKTAIQNSKNLETFDAQNPYRGVSEMWKIFEHEIFKVIL